MNLIKTKFIEIDWKNFDKLINLYRQVSFSCDKMIINYPRLNYGLLLALCCFLWLILIYIKKLWFWSLSSHSKILFVQCTNENSIRCVFVIRCGIWNVVIPHLVPLVVHTVSFELEQHWFCNSRYILGYWICIFGLGRIYGLLRVEVSSPK